MKEIKDGYLLEVVFTNRENGCKHESRESFVCGNLKQLKKCLDSSLVLDLLHDENDKIVEPEMERVYSNLTGVVDDKTVEREYKRLRKYYKIYLEVVEFSGFLNGNAESKSWNLNKNTVLKLSFI